MVVAAESIADGYTFPVVVVGRHLLLCLKVILQALIVLGVGTWIVSNGLNGMVVVGCELDVTQLVGLGVVWIDLA